MKIHYYIWLILDSSVIISGWVAVFIFMFNYKALDKTGRWIYYYTIICSIMVIALLIMNQNRINSAWLHNVRLFTQYLAAAGFYYHLIRYRWIKRLIVLTLLPLTVIFFLDLFRWEGHEIHNTIIFGIITALLIAYGIAFAFQLSANEALSDKMVPVTALPDFWYNAGLFILHCTAFPVFIVQNYWPRSHLPYFWVLLDVVLATGTNQFIFFCIGAYKARKLARSASQKPLDPTQKSQNT